MTDDEVLDRARADGFELVERMSAGQWAVGWARGDDERWPYLLEERQATSWMRDRLSRGCGVRLSTRSTERRDCRHRTPRAFLRPQSMEPQTART